MFGFLDQLLRKGDEFAEGLQDPAAARRFARSALLWVVVLGGYYGLVMGGYKLVRSGSGWNALTSMVKVPVLMLMTTALCFPALYVFGLAGGARLRASALWAALLAALVILGILLAALSPIVLFFLSTINAYVLVKFMHVIVWGIAGLGAVKFLRGTLRRMDPKLAGNGRLMTTWILLFGLVGMQSAWMLRPFIGRPHQVFRPFRHVGGSIFEDLYESVRHATRERPPRQGAPPGEERAY